MNLNIFQPRSLKARVTLFTLAIFLVSIWSLGFYASRMLREDMQGLLGEQQFSIVSLLAAQINEEMDGRLRALETVAASVTPAMLGKPVALQAMLEQRPVLQNLFGNFLMVVRPDGTVIVEVPLSPGRIGLNVMDRDYVAAALKEGKATIGKPVIGRVSLAPVIAMAVPIRDPHGKVIGALAGVINLGLPNFLNLIMEQRYGRTGEYLLIAPQYRLIVTASDKSRILGALPAPGVIPWIDRAVQGYEGSAIYVTLDGVEVLSSVKGIPVAGWYMVARLPAAEAFAPISDMQRRILIAAILLTLLAGGLTWWMLRRQLAPMLATAKTLATLSDSGQPPQPLPIARQDEIGELIGGFNRLLKTLAQQGEALRAREERYRMLYESMDEGFCVIEMINDPNGKAVDYRFVEINPAFIKQTGLTDALSKTMREMVPNHDVHWFEIYGKVARTGEAVRFENPATAMQRHYDVFAFRIGADGSQRVGVVFNDITERKQAEATRDRLAAIVENSNTAIFSRTLEGTIVSWNAGAEKMFGYSATEAIGKPATFNLPPGQNFGLAQLNEPILRGETSVPRETRRLTKDGRVIDVLRIFSPIKDSAGKIIGVSGVVHDITERKRVQEALRATSEQLQTLIRSAPLAIFTLDKNRLVTSWNTAAEQIYGWKASEVLGNPMPAGRAREEMARAFAEVLGGTQLVERQIQRLRRDGTWMFLNAVMAPLRDASGAISGVITIASDITERKRTEETRDRLAAIVENSNDAILSRTLDGTILSWNTGAERMFGYSATEAIGKPINFNLPPGPHPNLARNNERLLRGETIAPHELQRATKDGRVIDLLNRLSPIRDGVGNVIGASVILQDITERKRMQASLHESEKLYRSLFENLLNGFSYCRMLFEDGKPQDFIYLAVNKAFESQTGLRNVVGRKVTEVIPGIREADPQLFEIYGRVAMSGQPERFEMYVEVLQMWFWVSAYSPAHEHFVAVFDVITERKRAEEALRVSLEKYRVLFESFPLGISVTDAAGHLIETNRESERLLGISRDEHARRKYDGPEWRIVRPDGTPMPPDEYASVQALREKRLVEHVEMGIDKGGGEITWISVTAAPVPLEGYGVAIAYGDITARKQAEAALRNSRKRLRDLSQRLMEVEDATRRTINRELHDRVGANLSALNLNLSILASQLPQDALRAVGPRLQDTQELLEETTGHVRDLMMDLHPPALDDYGLAAALRGYAKTVGARAAVPITVHGEDLMPRLPPATETALFRVVQGALVNAVTHAHAKRIEIVFAASAGGTTLTIADDGVGFEAAQVALAPASWGLAIMRERAEAVGAELTVESAPGKGTRVCVEIPRGGGGGGEEECGVMNDE